jgi:glycosyltransferase involved in cell wall biosynthesis
VALNSPAVSVILPTFNRLKYLRAAVESVFAQTFPDWELIIADDGSAPETTAYLATLAPLPRVKLMLLEHCGNPSAVRNAAVRQSGGERLAFLDSDDLWLPRKLELQLKAQKEATRCRWSYTGLTRIDSTGSVMAGEFAGRRSVRGGDIFNQLLTLEAAVVTPSVMAERTLMAEVGGFDEQQKYFEEYDLWLRFSRVSEVCAIDEPLVMVRNHDEHYSADRVGVYEARLRLLDKVAALGGTAELNSMLQLERAKTLAALGAVCAASGDRARALRLLWKSRRLAWHGRKWWMASTSVGRTFAPAWLRNAARRIRQMHR